MNAGNLFQNIPENLDAELIEVIAEGNGRLRIERIVSRQHSSPPDFWYDQDSTEWVAVLSGNAVLSFKGGDCRQLQPGDWIKIPPHTPHRVDSTAADMDTVWLAIHWD